MACTGCRLTGSLWVFITLYSANNRSPIASNATRPVLSGMIVYLGNEDVDGYDGHSGGDGLVVVGVDGHNGHSGAVCWTVGGPWW